MERKEPLGSLSSFCWLPGGRVEVTGRNLFFLSFISSNKLIFFFGRESTALTDGVDCIVLLLLVLISAMRLVRRGQNVAPLDFVSLNLFMSSSKTLGIDGRFFDFGFKINVPDFSMESKRARCSFDFLFAESGNGSPFLPSNFRTGGQEYVFFNTFVDLVGYRRSPARRISDSKLDGIKLAPLGYSIIAFNIMLIAVFA